MSCLQEAAGSPRQVATKAGHGPDRSARRIGNSVARRIVYACRQIAVVCLLGCRCRPAPRPPAPIAGSPTRRSARTAKRSGTLLKERVDVNVPQADGATALHWAAHWDDVDLANLLIRSGANVQSATDYGITPLALACTNGNAAMVALLLNAGANPNAARSTGETPLMTASRTGNLDAVKALLAHGASVNAMEPIESQTALMWAISERHAGVARALIELGADVHARTTSGFTPLLFAARAGDLESTRMLLAAGADANETSSEGASALLVATVRGHAQVATFLLDRGADPNADRAGYTALHWASGIWETELNGANGIVTQADDGEWNSLGGVKAGKLELVKALLSHGANPNARLEKTPPRVGYTQLQVEQRIAGVNAYPGATPFLLAAMAGDDRGHEGAGGRRRRPAAEDQGRHHRTDACGWLGPLLSGEPGDRGPSARSRQGGARARR